jgi:hypothetical protein
MAPNKARLHLAFYARPKFPETYHFALLVCPKDSEKAILEAIPVSKYHVKNTLRNIDGSLSQPWVPDFSLVVPTTDPRLLSRVIIAKILQPQKVQQILKEVPIFQSDTKEGENFDCLEWVRLAVESLRTAEVITKSPDWEETMNQARRYVEDEKVKGRWRISWIGSNPERIPTLDILTARKIVE